MIPAELQALFDEHKALTAKISKTNFHKNLLGIPHRELVARYIDFVNENDIYSNHDLPSLPSKSSTSSILEIGEDNDLIVYVGNFVLFKGTRKYLKRVCNLYPERNKIEQKIKQIKRQKRHPLK